MECYKRSAMRPSSEIPGIDMKKRLATLLFVVITACAPKPAPEMTLERLLDAHADARGGKAALENLQTMTVDLEIIEPDFTVTGHYRASRDGQMRIDVYAGDQRVFTEALGPDGGWQMFDDGEVADLSPDGDAALQRGIIGTAPHAGTTGAKRLARVAVRGRRWDGRRERVDRARVRT